MVKNQIFESSPKSKIPNLSYKVISKDFTSKISIKYDKITNFKYQAKTKKRSDKERDLAPKMKYL